MNRLESRGTLRIAIKGAGLEPDSVTPDQLKVVFEKLMPVELERRDIADGAKVCAAAVQDLAAAPAEQDESPDLDEVFGRLGGD